MLKRMFLLGAMLAGALLLAGDPYFQGKCDKNLLYQPGEPATFTLTAFDGDGTQRYLYPRCRRYLRPLRHQSDPDELLGQHAYRRPCL